MAGEEEKTPMELVEEALSRGGPPTDEEMKKELLRSQENLKSIEARIATLEEWIKKVKCLIFSECPDEDLYIRVTTDGLRRERAEEVLKEAREDFAKWTKEKQNLEEERDAIERLVRFLEHHFASPDVNVDPAASSSVDA